MKRSDRVHLEELMGLAASGQLARSDVVAIFMYVRNDAAGRSMLRDIGDSIAHDERDRGFAFNYVKAFIEHIHDVFSNGGLLKIDIFFPVDEVLAQLMSVMDSSGIRFSRLGMKAHRQMWVDLLASALDGTTFETPLASAVLSASPPTLDITFKESIDGAAIKWRRDLTIAVPFLVETKQLPATRR